MLYATPKKLSKKSSQCGFTLIELIVVTALAIILLLAITDIYLSVFSAQKKGSNNEKVLTELRTIVDTAGREISFGSTFTNTSCDGCIFAFQTKPRPDMPGRQIYYRLTNGAITKGIQTPGTTPCDELPIPESCYQKLTSDATTISDLKFSVFNNNAADKKAIITMEIVGTVALGSAYQSPFQISSSFSPRTTQIPGAILQRDNQKPQLKITSPDHCVKNSGPCVAGDPFGVPAINYEHYLDVAAPSSAGKIDISITAKDNVGIASLEWQNLTRYFHDSLTPSDPYPSYPNSDTICSAVTTPCPTGEFSRTISNIALAPGLVNRIRFTFKDAEGNSGELRFDIKQTDSIPLPPPKPWWDTANTPAQICSAPPYEIGYYVYLPASPIGNYARSMSVFRCVLHLDSTRTGCVGNTNIPDSSDRANAILYGKTAEDNYASNGHYTPLAAAPKKYYDYGKTPPDPYNPSPSLNTSWVYPPSFHDNNSPPGSYDANASGFAVGDQVFYCAKSYDYRYNESSTGNESDCKFPNNPFGKPSRYPVIIETTPASCGTVNNSYTLEIIEPSPANILRVFVSGDQGTQSQDSNQIHIKVVPINGFNKNVSLTLLPDTSGNPSGLIPTLQPITINSSLNSILSVTVPNTTNETVTGNNPYIIQLKGSSVEATPKTYTLPITLIVALSDAGEI